MVPGRPDRSAVGSHHRKGTPTPVEGTVEAPSPDRRREGLRDGGRRPEPEVSGQVGLVVE